MNKELEEYLYRFYNLLGTWRDMKLDSPFYALVVFLKSIGMGYLFHVLFNILHWVYGTIKVMNAAVPTQASGADSTGVAQRFEQAVSSGGFPELWTITYPFFIVAYAAGRTTARIGNVLGYLVGLFFLWVALLPEIGSSTGLQELIPIAIAKVVAFGFGAWSTKRDSSLWSDRRTSRKAKTGMFRYTLGRFRTQEEAQIALAQIQRFLQASSYVSNKSAEVVTHDKESFSVSGEVYGVKYALPSVRKSLEALLQQGGKKFEATSIIDVGETN